MNPILRCKWLAAVCIKERDLNPSSTVRFEHFPPDSFDRKGNEDVAQQGGCAKHFHWYPSPGVIKYLTFTISLQTYSWECLKNILTIYLEYKSCCKLRYCYLKQQNKNVHYKIAKNYMLLKNARIRKIKTATKSEYFVPLPPEPRRINLVEQYFEIGYWYRGVFHQELHCIIKLHLLFWVALVIWTFMRSSKLTSFRQLLMGIMSIFWWSLCRAFIAGNLI